MTIIFALVAVNGTDNNNVENLLNESMTLINNSKYEDALIYLDKILTLDENNLQALSNKGGLLIKLEKYDEAIEYLDKAIKIKPDFVEALNNKGIALFNIGKYSDAAIIFYESSKIDPDNQISKYNAREVIQKIPYVWEKGYVKIELRDKEDNLIGYTEAYQFVMKNPLANIALEEKKWENIEINGIDVQRLQNTWTFNFKETGIYARTDITLAVGSVTYNVIQILHDGFLVEEGDHAKVVLDLFKTS